jgi:hypothetical protein
MTRLLVRSMSLGVPCCLVATMLGLAGELPKGKPGHEKGSDGQRVRKYTKEWTDDYGNYNKDVYLAYTKTLKDEKGAEVVAEIWHGKATGFHENGSKSWEGVYRHGKREGEFTTWSKDSTRTGFMAFEQGKMHGKYTQRAEDGRKMREETYEKGKLNGEAHWWDGDGKLLLTGTYRDGLPWTGKFAELDSSPRATWVVRRYERGKRVSEEKLTGKWWW